MHLADLLWSLLVIYCIVIYFIMLFRVIFDIFRDKDMSGGMKALWLFFLFFFPFIALLVYVIARGKGMAERDVKQLAHAQEAQADYIRTVAGGGSNAADQIAKAHELLTSGAISQAEFDGIKAKALA